MKNEWDTYKNFLRVSENEIKQFANEQGTKVKQMKTTVVQSKAVPLKATATKAVKHRK